MTLNNRNPDNTLDNLLSDERFLLLVVLHATLAFAKFLMLPVEELPPGLRRNPRRWDLQPAIEAYVRKHGRMVLDGMGKPARMNREQFDRFESAMALYLPAGPRMVYGRSRLPLGGANDDHYGQDGAA